MSDLPPPTGRPVAFALYVDPWAEQARRHAAHRAERSSRRRRRLIRFGGPAVVLLVGGATAAVVLAADRDAEPAAASSTLVQGPLGTSTTGDRTPSAESVSVEEVWLLDRGDGDYDWGAVVSSASDVVRRDLAVTTSLLDADGTVLLVEDVVIAQLVPDGRAVVGGVVQVGDVAPMRIEVTATLGSAAAGTGATAVLSDVRRVSSGQVDRDDRLLGSIEVLDADLSAVRVAAMWRDENGSVIASIFEVVEIDASNQSADFSLRLPRAIVPAGEPDDIVANVANMANGN